MSRTLLHVSDLHFGRIEPGLPEALLEAASLIRPGIVVISGDLTQRARTAEFQHARAFLDRLPKPQIVVPGNHDVPLHNLYGRFVQRLARYKTYITPDLQPAYLDAEIAVYGVNTARSLTWKGGRINTLQMESLRRRLCETPEDVTQVVVTHHPFDIPDGFHSRDLVGSARAALDSWTACGADLLLCGHLHIADSTTSLNRYGAASSHAILVTAGTATSNRGRGAPNSFNVITIENRRSISVNKWLWDGTAQRFQKTADVKFEKTPAGWKPHTADMV